MSWLFDVDRMVIDTRRSSRLCVLCKGAHLLCGKNRCPIVVRASVMYEAVRYFDKLDVEGSSPPGVFVGRFGYPRVYVGPLTPPFKGDTRILDTPEYWFGMSIEDIVRFRSILLRGEKPLHVDSASNPDELLQTLQEIAMSQKPVDLEVKLARKPRVSLILDDEVQPLGASAPISKIRLEGNIYVDRRIEEAYYDRDLRAVDAVFDLYRSGVPVSSIQKAFSLGLLGVGSNRRLVPTRWSITAVDSMISEKLLGNVKRYPPIPVYLLFESVYLDNRFEILMIPGFWSYESIEAWYPKTVWNPDGRMPIVEGDWEGYHGRRSYAAIGGCYYAARLAVAEYLDSIRRQASVLILREVHPGYIMPVGVWHVREHVRNALKRKPMVYQSIGEALSRISERLEIPLEIWVEHSRLLRRELYQQRIRSYVSGS
ncbi:MAG: Nre family DNA repair protein [Nitrososphaerota archaeon]|nr:Nre family DNA repair protein [Candidatus Bathyarchaeota archaeon]MDW8061182.1 Nre family DNA repair protein [Nitrososphaerota archaeon]